jgi:hypothetical protein
MRACVERLVARCPPFRPGSEAPRATCLARLNYRSIWRQFLGLGLSLSFGYLPKEFSNDIVLGVAQFRWATNGDQGRFEPPYACCQMCWRRMAPNSAAGWP